MGYREEEIVGRHHSMFVDPATNDQRAYTAFWAALNRGEFQAGEFRRLAKGGREVWNQATYTPIVDEEGEVFKVVKFASDVTALVQERQSRAEAHRRIDCRSPGDRGGSGGGR